MDDSTASSGLAALAICESLLLSLTESNTLQEGEARSILEDASAANRNAVPLTQGDRQHESAADMIDLILAGRNSVRFD